MISLPDAQKLPDERTWCPDCQVGYGHVVSCVWYVGWTHDNLRKDVQGVWQSDSDSV